MADPQTRKEIAPRIDLAYFRRWHWLRVARFVATMVLLGAAAFWVIGASALRNKKIYANGPVSHGHSFIEERCGSCHTEGFRKVYDASCLQCHAAAVGLPHVPAGRGRDPACGVCHAEHRGSTLLSAVKDKHCNACHEDHSDITSLETHIWFRPQPRDQRLRFNHLKHLDLDLVGGPLECDACHVVDGRNFGPIRFAEHCVRCHKETVSADIDIVVPHGFQIGELRDWIAAVYVRVWLAKRPKEVEPQASVPGRSDTGPPDWAVALAERSRVAQTALFQPGRGCLLCHVAQGEEILSPEIPSRWLPRARFDHQTHRFQSCDRCHDLREATSADVLVLPRVETCRACHHRHGARARCVTCHPFHPTGALR
ncbi:MAG: cytochrome c3 family protein [Planctomycetota bacterium]|jgi:hypothetical protein